MELNEKLPETCPFEKGGFCHALTCYSRQRCRAKDNRGNPVYLKDREKFKEAESGKDKGTEVREVNCGSPIVFP